MTLGKKSELTKLKAQERLRALIEKDTNERKKAPFDPRVSFRWYVENRFLVNHRSSWRPATLHSMTSELRLYILPEFGDKPIGEIERHECSLFLEKLAEEYSKAVVLHCKVTVKAIFEDAIGGFDPGKARHGKARSTTRPRPTTATRW